MRAHADRGGQAAGHQRKAGYAVIFQFARLGRFDRFIRRGHRILHGDRRGKSGSYNRLFFTQIFPDVKRDSYDDDQPLHHVCEIALHTHELQADLEHLEHKHAN